MKLHSRHQNSLRVNVCFEVTYSRVTTGGLPISRQCPREGSAEDFAELVHFDDDEGHVVKGGIAATQQRSRGLKCGRRYIFCPWPRRSIQLKEIADFVQLCLRACGLLVRAQRRDDGPLRMHLPANRSARV